MKKNNTIYTKTTYILIIINIIVLIINILIITYTNYSISYKLESIDNQENYYDISQELSVNKNNLKTIKNCMNDAIANNETDKKMFIECRNRITD